MNNFQYMKDYDIERPDSDFPGYDENAEIWPLETFEEFEDDCPDEF